MEKEADGIDRRKGPFRGPYPPNAWFWLLAVGWSLAVLVSYAWVIELESEELKEHALHDADVYIIKTVSFRKWGAEHGGVYVPVTEGTPPNPLLDFIPERDIETPSGKKLTLMNPAYMTRQLFELEEKVLNVRGHLTSLNPLRPENAADAWETKALKAFELGEKEVAEFDIINGEKHMRVMRPLYVEKSCLKCHGKQGYQEGQVRGGISITLPMSTFKEAEGPRLLALRLTHGLIWLFGVLGLKYSSSVIRRHVVSLNQTTTALRESRDQMKQALLNSIMAVWKTVEARDPYTAGHQKSVADLSVLIAKELELEEEHIENILLGASIHDIGKIQVPAEVLTKPSRLSELEFKLIQAHPKNGYEIINDIDFPSEVKNIVLQHHERLDGSGYPQGLRGDEIDLGARIVAVADIIDAISTDRPYRPAKGLDAAMTEIRRQSGVTLDADVVDACLKVVA